MIFTARKRSLRRLCFYRCLSVHGGACVAEGSVHGKGGHMWGVCMGGEACMAGGVGGRGGMHGGGCAWRGHVWQGGMHGRAGGRVWQILRDTVNERAVCILLECILVLRKRAVRYGSFVFCKKYLFGVIANFRLFLLFPLLLGEKKIVKKFYKMDAALFKNWYTLTGLKSCQIVGFCHQLKACPPPPPESGKS